jgi:hypothetical protein
LTRPSWTEAEMHGNPHYRRRRRTKMNRIPTQKRCSR